MEKQGKGSGLKTEIHYAAVYTFRGGKVFSVKEYNTRAEALEAGGLPGQDAHADSS